MKSIIRNQSMYNIIRNPSMCQFLLILCDHMHDRLNCHYPMIACEQIPHCHTLSSFFFILCHSWVDDVDFVLTLPGMDPWVE